MAVQDIDDDVKLAVVEQISDCQSPANVEICQCRAFDGRHEVKLFPLDISEEQWTLRPGGSPVGVVNRRVNMAVCNHDILPAVVVEVQERRRPNQETGRWVRQFPSDS